jgi:hypothetical protein
MYEDITAGINVGILVFLIFSIILISRYRKFEKPETHGVVDMIITSLVVFGIIILFDLVIDLQEVGYFGFLDSIDPSLLSTGMYLVLVPLVAVLFLAASFSVRELEK